ncbi:MAG TPA: helix-hairpin-helix domain-containing protein [Gemmatimonadales bacterium]|nr:helix-hairpin-helix domain-containing protein [Gemmatimonadales bacterium]
MDVNRLVAERLEEMARLLEEQGANRFRVAAYRRGAEAVRGLGRPLPDLVVEGGMEALDAVPGIGPRLARIIRDLVDTGRSPMLERLRGESDPVALLATVPGLGPTLAERVHERLGVSTLEALEAAAHDGRLGTVPGLGPRRLEAVRQSLAARLARTRPRPPTGPAEPPVAELLEVDREYRRRARKGTLRHIAPRRFNPAGEAWLPVLHTARGPREYTALFSNTALAHRLGRTHDWVVIYHDGAGPEHQDTVVTAGRGPLEGRRVVRGREGECLELYAAGEAPGSADEG